MKLETDCLLPGQCALDVDEEGSNRKVEREVGFKKRKGREL